MCEWKVIEERTRRFPAHHALEEHNRFVVGPWVVQIVHSAWLLGRGVCWGGRVLSRALWLRS